MNSLERSLQLGLIGSLIVLLFIFWWTITLSSRLLTDSFVFSQLRQDAERASAELVLDELLGDDPSAAQQKFKLSMQPLASADYFHVKLVDGLFIAFGSPADLSSQLPMLVPGQQIKLQHASRANDPLLFWLGGYQQAGQEFTIAAGKDVTPVRQRLEVFQWFSALIAVVLLAALLGIQRFIVKRSLQKLDVIRRDMLRLEQGRIVALPEEVPSEIQPLVREFNQLLRRNDQRLRQSRNAVGNLAHSLKGPLNLLLRSSNQDDIDQAAKEQIGQSSEHIRRLIESELKRARLAGRGGSGTRLDINAELPAMIGLLKQVYSDKTVEVGYTIAADVDLVHDRQDMLELIGNLLDNAVKWSRSRVLLDVSRASGIMIEVEDDGPGCSPEMLGQLTGRGVRLDESVAGHGLGLSIVKDIVDTYDGQLQFQASTQLGGLKVLVFLPLHAQT